jgi:hypothetical protein
MSAIPIRNENEKKKWKKATRFLLERAFTQGTKNNRKKKIIILFFKEMNLYHNTLPVFHLLFFHAILCAPVAVVNVYFRDIS